MLKVASYLLIAELVASESTHLTTCVTRPANLSTTIYLTIQVCHLLLTRASVKSATYLLVIQMSLCQALTEKLMIAVLHS